MWWSMLCLLLLAAAAFEAYRSAIEFRRTEREAGRDPSLRNGWRDAAPSSPRARGGAFDWWLFDDLGDGGGFDGGGDGGGGGD